jgi:hypothetical protein
MEDIAEPSVQQPQVEQPPKKLSVDDFASKIKAKYPEYAKVDNSQLAKKIVEKYPDYASQVDFAPEKKNPIQNASASGSNNSHADVINVAKQQQQIQRQPKSAPSKDESIMGKVINALYLPAFNEGFNDLVVKPLAGATDLVDRSFDKAYRSITGEKTPEWMRESKNSIFKSLAKSLQSDYDNRDKPKNIVSETAEGVVGAMPLIASLYTGEGEVSLAQKAPQFVSKVTKLLATTKAATAFHEATDKKEGLAQSVSDATVGGEKGALEGLALDAQMLTAGALGKGVANKLAESGLLAGGKAGEALVHALSTGTVFGGTSVMQDLIDGKDVNAHEAAKQFGTGLAFELIPVAKSINEEVGKKITDHKILQNAAVSTAASNLHAESVIRTLTNTNPEQLKQIADNITDNHETLYANSLEHGMKAYDSDDPSEKKSLYADQLLLKTQGDVKFMQDKLKTDAPEIKQQIEDSDELHPQEKQDLINKIDLLTPNPTDNEKDEQSMAERPAINGEGQQQENEDQTQISNAGNGQEKGDAESENNVVNSGEAQAEPEIANKKGEDNAIQEQETGEVGVRQPSAVGEGVGGQDQPKEITEPGKEENTEPKTTGIKKVISEATRIEKNLPEVKLSKLGTDNEALQRGKKAVDTGDIKPTEVASRVVDDPNGGIYTPAEAESMQYYGHQLAREETNLRSKLSDVKGNEEAETLLHSNLQQLNDKIDQKTQADRINSRSWGNLGNIMQIEADPSFSPSNIRSIIRENYGGKIPKEVEERISKAETDRDKAIADLKKATEANIKKNGDQVIDKMRKSIKLVKQTKAELEAEAEQLKKELLKAFKADASRVNSGIPLPTETLAVLGKLAVNYFKQGVKDFEGLANKIYDDLKETGVDKKSIREYLSNYEPLRDEAKEKESERLGRKERMINKQLETGKLRDYSKKPKIVFKKDNDIIRAEQRVADAEYRLKQEKSKSYRTTEDKYQRGLNWIIRWERRSVLASPMILEKLAAAATIGSALNRIPKQIIGGIFSKALKGIAEKAPIEGGLNIDAELAFWKEFSNPQKFVNNAWEILKTGASPLTRKYESQSHEHFAGYDALMDLHAIIKDPPKRATFEASLRYAYNWAAKNGLDYTDPLIKKSLENAAFKRAEYEIFQENNGVAKRVNDFINSERKRTDFEATKKFLYKFLIPISTVPLNIARRVGSSVFGLPHGLYEVNKAYQKGVDNLEPEQADYILRQLKNGSVGLAYYAFGLFASKAILGGLWNKDDKKGMKPKFNQAAFDEMKGGQYSIDKRIQHAMPLQLAQLGATTARVYNYYLDAPTDDPEYQKILKSLAHSMAATVGTQIEQIPMIQEPKQAVESLSDPYERKKFGEDLKRRVGFSILNDLGITKKDTETPLDKKLSTVTNDDGDKQTLPDDLLKERKLFFSKELSDKSNVKEWTDDFNDDWEDDANQKKLKKLSDYWKNVIGRSDKYIQDKLDDMKAEALDKYLEKQALDTSEEDISDKVNELPKKKNTFSIRH